MFSSKNMVIKTQGINRYRRFAFDIYANVTLWFIEKPWVSCKLFLLSIVIKNGGPSEGNDTFGL